MKASIRLGRIAGIEIGINYSWFLVLGLMSWYLSAVLMPEMFPGWAVQVYWTTGIVAALLLFGSVLVHELAHSLVATARGFRVEGITLFFLGGVSNLKAESGRARDEFAISIVGPLTSLALAVLFGVVLLSFRGADGVATVRVWFLTFVTISNSPALAVVWYLSVINLALAAFNLLPAFPLDGGRVLRSLVWGVTGSLARATRVAAWGGQTMGLLLMALGALQVLDGNLLGGVWYALIGWFLHGAAGASQREMELKTGSAGIRVSDVMDRQPPTIRPEAPVSEVVFDYILKLDARSLPVCDGDRLVGIISLTDVKNVPQYRWSGVRVSEVMTRAPLRVVAPDDDLFHALAVLGEHAIHQAPVVEGDRLVGLLTRAHIVRYMHSRRELEIK